MALPLVAFITTLPDTGLRMRVLTAGAGRVFSQVHEYEVSTRQTPGRNLGLTRFPRQTPASAAWIGTRSFEWPGIEVPPVPGGQGFEGGARIPGGEPSDVGGRTRRIGCVARLSRVSRPAPGAIAPVNRR